MLSFWLLCACSTALGREKLTIFNAREVRIYGKDEKSPKTADAVDRIRQGSLFNTRSKFKNSKDFYRSSCILEHIASCVITGMFEYDEGHVERARFLLTNACDEGDEAGCRSLGLIEAREGRFPASIEPLEKSCDSGDSEACKVLGSVRSRLLE